MSDNTPNPGLQKLYRERDSKFDEIVACLGRELHSNAGPLSEAARARLIENAEELTDSWAAAEYNHCPQEPSTALQRLLSEHQLICASIIKIIDAGS